MHASHQFEGRKHLADFSRPRLRFGLSHRLCVCVCVMSVYFG